MSTLWVLSPMARAGLSAARSMFAELVAEWSDRQPVCGSQRQAEHGQWNITPTVRCYAVEGITSPDGRVFGKMAHFERFSEGVYRNIEGHKYQPVFKGAVKYYK